MDTSHLLQTALGFHAANRLPEARMVYQQILAIDPQHGEALHQLGRLNGQMGDREKAVELLTQSAQFAPENSETWADLALALQYLNRSSEAVDAANRAVALNPKHAEALNTLGNAQFSLGDTKAAEAAYAASVKARHNYAIARANLARLLANRGDLASAISHYETVIKQVPKNAGHRADFASVLLEAHEAPRALEQANSAVALGPRVSRHFEVLSKAYFQFDDLDAALTAQRQAVTLDPRNAMGLNNLGLLLANLGLLDEAIDCYDRAMAIDPTRAMVGSNRLCAMHYTARFTPAQIYAEHERWNRQYAQSFAAPASYPNSRDPERPIRIGFISPDLREHSVARFILPLIESQDRSLYPIYCYANVASPDAFTEKFQAHSDGWLNVHGMDEDAIAARVREDQIDILIDLAGHTPGNRLLVLARKPAPVQVTYQGYPDTTGLTAVDYRITDALADPPGMTQQYHSEQLVYLPRTNWCYRVDEDAPGVSPAPSANGGGVTFGSFNYLPKLSDPLLAMWARILLAVPGSRLLVKARSLSALSARERVLGVFKRTGVSADRLTLMGFVPTQSQHLAEYSRIDIALDSYPYHGTTTTCESLWMGVPVITLAGETHVSRVGVSLLHNVGLGELVASSEEQYVRKAAALANDQAMLTDIRRTLRDRMRASPLLDAATFARDMEAIYRRIWREWCARS